MTLTLETEHHHEVIRTQVLMISNNTYDLSQMGIEAPNFGPLTDAMLLGSPAVLPPGALQPRIEPEIGLRLGRRLAGPCSVSEVLGACDAALACLEVVDSVWSGYRFTLADNTDNVTEEPAR